MNSTLDRLGSGRFGVRIGTCTSVFIIYKIESYLSTDTYQQTIGVHLRPASDDAIRRRYAANNIACRRPAKYPILKLRIR